MPARFLSNALGRLLSVLALVLIGACGGSESDPSSAGFPAVPGVYQLKRVNGKDLVIGDGEHLFINGVLDLGPDGTWCMGINWRGQLYSRWSADRGTYSQASGLSFASPEGENAQFSGAV